MVISNSKSKKNMNIQEIYLFASIVSNLCKIIQFIYEIIKTKKSE